MRFLLCQIHQTTPDIPDLGMGRIINRRPAASAQQTAPVATPSQTTLTDTQAGRLGFEDAKKLEGIIDNLPLSKEEKDNIRANLARIADNHNLRNEFNGCMKILAKYPEAQNAILSVLAFSIKNNDAPEKINAKIGETFRNAYGHQLANLAVDPKVPDTERNNFRSILIDSNDRVLNDWGKVIGRTPEFKEAMAIARSQTATMEERKTALGKLSPAEAEEIMQGIKDYVDDPHTPDPRRKAYGELSLLNARALLLLGKDYEAAARIAVGTALKAGVSIPSNLSHLLPDSKIPSNNIKINYVDTKAEELINKCLETIANIIEKADKGEELQSSLNQLQQELKDLEKRIMEQYIRNGKEFTTELEKNLERIQSMAKILNPQVREKLMGLFVSFNGEKPNVLDVLELLNAIVKQRKSK